MARSTCDLSIVIVSWNVCELLCACLRSIEQSSQPSEQLGQEQRLFGPTPAATATTSASTLEVIVFDNASQDGSVEAVSAQFPWVRLLISEENLGFPGGCNRGYAASRGRFVYFLNADTELVGDSLWRLYTAIETEPTISMVGPKLRYADNTLQNNRRRFPTPYTLFWESTWLGQLWADNPWVRHMHMLDTPDDIAHEVDWLVGAAMLTRRGALESLSTPDGVGPFDEDFFMYSEEVDLCKRLKAAGWRIVYEPESLVIHYEGRSSEQVIAARHIHFNTSKVRYAQKHMGERWAESLRQYLLFEFRLQHSLERAKRWLGHKPRLRTERIQVYRQVIDSQLRPKSSKLSNG